MLPVAHKKIDNTTLLGNIGKKRDVFCGLGKSISKRAGKGETHYRSFFVVFDRYIHLFIKRSLTNVCVHCCELTKLSIINWILLMNMSINGYI